MATTFPEPAPRSGALIGLLAAALACIGGAGVGLWRLSRVPESLALAITSWPGYEYFYLAEQRQLARPLGLDLRVKQYTSLADQRQAFERGDVAAMATTLPEAIAVCQNVPARCPLLVLVLDESRGADRLISRTALVGPSNLAGRQVGLERAVLAEYLLLRSLAGTGLTLGDLKLRFDGPVGLVERLRRGELDAIVTYAPHDAPLERDRRFRELFNSAAIPGEVVDVLAVDPELAQRQPGELRALVRTWWAARDYAARHRDEAQALMAGRQRIQPDQFRATEARIHYPGQEEQAALLAEAGPLARSLQRMAGLMQVSGRLRADAPLPRLSGSFLEGR